MNHDRLRRLLVVVRVTILALLYVCLIVQVEAQQALGPTVEELGRRIQTMENLDLAQRLTRLETSSETNGRVLIAILVAVIIQFLHGLIERFGKKST